MYVTACARFCRLIVLAGDVVFERLHCKNPLQWFSKWGFGTSRGPMSTPRMVPSKNEKHLSRTMNFTLSNYHAVEKTISSLKLQAANNWPSHLPPRVLSRPLGAATMYFCNRQTLHAQLQCSHHRHVDVCTEQSFHFFHFMLLYITDLFSSAIIFISSVSPIVVPR